MKVTLAGHGSGNPTTKDMTEYCATRQANGRGLVEVRRLALTAEQRQAMHDNYKTILGRNIYNQNLRDYCYKPYKGKYYSDCSSSICRTAEKVGIKGVASLNTAGMHYNWNAVDDAVIVNGQIQNPEVLLVGDALMFKGSDPSRPLQIGHTEMVYEITGVSKDSVPTQNPGNAAYAESRIWYRVHQETYGWLAPVHDGQTSGITGQSKQIEAVKIDCKLSGVKIKAKAHIQSKGTVDYGYITSDTVIGTIGQKLRLEALELSAEGLPEGQKLYVRYHIQGDGWSNWIEGGTMAGSAGLGKRLEGIQIKIQ